MARPPSKRTFGEITRLPSGRYRARYTAPDGQRYSAPTTFVARLDAETWLGQQEHIISRGDWTPPTRQTPKDAPAAPATLATYAQRVIARRTLRPATIALYEKLLRVAINPTLGNQPLDAIRPADIATWYATQRRTPTQQANAYGLLKSIYKDAVDDELVERNPCRIKAGAQKHRAKLIEILTIEELNTYIAAIPPARRPALLLAGWCGLRSGEVRGLRVQDLNLTTGVVHIRQAITSINGHLLIGPPKTQAGIRDITIPPHLLPQLRVLLADRVQREPDALLFTASDDATPMNDSVLRDAHDKGKMAINKPGLTIHALRHTSATMAAQLGATIAELQARIGHSTPTMAMRYQHAATHRDTLLAHKMSQAATRPTK